LKGKIPILVPKCSVHFQGVPEFIVGTIVGIDLPCLEG